MVPARQQSGPDASRAQHGVWPRNSQRIAESPHITLHNIVIDCFTMARHSLSPRLSRSSWPENGSAVTVGVKHWPARGPLAFGPRNANASPSPSGSPPARMDWREALWHSALEMPMLHPRPQVHHLPAWTGEKPSGIRPGPKRGWHVHTGSAGILKMASSEDRSPSGWPEKRSLVVGCAPPETVARLLVRTAFSSSMVPARR